jgi:hypothetical protein
MGTAVGVAGTVASRAIEDNFGDDSGYESGNESEEDPGNDFGDDSEDEPEDDSRSAFESATGSNPEIASGSGTGSWCGDGARGHSQAQPAWTRARALAADGSMMAARWTGWPAASSSR